MAPLPTTPPALLPYRAPRRRPAARAAAPAQLAPAPVQLAPVLLLALSLVFASAPLARGGEAPAAPSGAPPPAPACVVAVGGRTFDLGTLGPEPLSFTSTETDSPGWTYTFAACGEMAPVPAACSGAPPGSAALQQTSGWGGGGACYGIGTSTSRTFVSTETGVALTFSGGDGGRSSVVTVECADVARPQVVRWGHGAGPTTYVALVRARAGCAIECTRDSITGNVCGGKEHGACTTFWNGAEGVSRCVCSKGFAGVACLDIVGSASLDAGPASFPDSASSSKMSMVAGLSFGSAEVYGVMLLAFCAAVFLVCVLLQRDRARWPVLPQFLPPLFLALLLFLSGASFTSVFPVDFGNLASASRDCPTSTLPLLSRPAVLLKASELPLSVSFRFAGASCDDFQASSVGRSTLLLQRVTVEGPQPSEWLYLLAHTPEAPLSIEGAMTRTEAMMAVAYKKILADTTKWRDTEIARRYAVIEIGVHGGWFASLAFKFGGHRVIGFDMQPLCVAISRCTLQVNGASAASSVVLNRYVSHGNTTINVSGTSCGGAFGLDNHERGNIAVHPVHLGRFFSDAEILARLGLDPDFEAPLLKSDTEGFEAIIMETALPLLGRIHNVLLEVFAVRWAPSGIDDTRALAVFKCLHAAGMDEMVDLPRRDVDYIAPGEIDLNDLPAGRLRKTWAEWREQLGFVMAQKNGLYNPNMWLRWGSEDARKHVMRNGLGGVGACAGPLARNTN